MGNIIFKEDLKNVLSDYKTHSDSIYVAKVSGKGLSTEDFTTAEKNKLASAATLDANNKIPLANLPAEFNAVTTVADIAARNALTGNYDGRNVFVTDASSDNTVSSGWAIYKYTASNTSWVKIAEGESLDLVLDWSNVQNVPNNILYKTDVKNNLTSTDTDKPLSANQGKVLKDAIDTINTTIGASSTLSSSDISTMMGEIFA